MAGGRDVDDLTAKRVHKGIVFTFRIADDHVILCHKEDIADLPLRGEGFAGARGTEDQAVRVLELLPVHHDHVVGEGIESVVKGFTLHEQFLCRERHEDRC